MSDTTSWQRLSGCTGHDPEMWFQERKKSAVAKATTRIAKAICGACLVRDDCLAEAQRVEGVTSPDRRHGIRGGLTGTQRHSLVRPRREKASTEAAP
ncbi:hypothetical protein HY68_01295 [Streptomyces sp. AcH 505]|uniref:WhiB family transcriptional regulator n=1 Tax=Streptomyces sp. AcH 505 TaxID=352211 RepID=UPI000591B80D|nr:hypothetical protein HY68_01295 [Streptomyces sp. AcH 505]